MAKRYKNFKEFWPYYLSEHTKPETRRLHIFGTMVGIALALSALAAGNPWLLALGIFAGYFFAWAGHFLYENNRPATFSYPLLSLQGDFYMFWLWLTGRLPYEIKKHSK